MKNHQTTPDYLKYLPLIALIGLSVGINTFLDSYLFLVKKFSTSEPLNWWLNFGKNLIFFTIENGIFWYVAYKIYNKYRTALLAFMACLACYLVGNLLNHFLHLSQIQNIIFNYFYTVLIIIPYSLFVFYSTKNIFKTFIVSLLVFILLEGTQLLSTGSYLISNTFADILSLFGVNGNAQNYIVSWRYEYSYGTHGSIYYWSILGNIAFFIILSVIKFEALNLVAKKETSLFNSSKLELSNNYSKPQISILFYSTRILIDSFVFGLIGIKSYLNNTNINKYQMSLYVIFGLIALFILIYFHRKYLIEFLISKDKVPSWFYWFLLIPFLNLIIFPIGLLFLNNKLDLHGRIERLKEASSENGAIGIALLIILVQSISLISTLINQGLSISSLFSFIGLILVIAFMFGKYYNYYILIGSAVLLTLLILFVTNVNSFDDMVFSVVRIPYAIVTVFMLYGLFHIYRFSAVEEDQKQEEAIKQEE